MNTLKRTIIVPYDFTPRSDYALQHGVQFAKMLKNTLTLLHIVQNPNTADDILLKLNGIAEDTKRRFGIKPLTLVKEGIVIKEIKSIAQDINATLVIMKTDGPKGFQKYFGSKAVKVMYKSQVPFIVVQSPPLRYNLKKVVVPIDFRAENKEKLKWINFLVKFYKSNIYLFRPNRSDYRVKNNLKFATRFLDGREINYELVHARGKIDFATETIEFSRFIRADLIVIMFSKNLSIEKFILGLSEQKYISNQYKIPVMCLNPNIDLHRLGGFN